MSHLFSEFDPVTAEQWKQKIIKDLKGEAFEALISNQSNGISFQPFYTSEDLTGKSASIHNSGPWDSCYEILVTNEETANKQAITALEMGASGLVFHIYKKIDLKKLLNGISLEHIHTQFCICYDAIGLIDELNGQYGQVNAYNNKFNCHINLDPIHLFAYYGEWHDDEVKDLQAIQQLQHIPVRGHLYQEAGALQINELAITLAHLNEYLHLVTQNGPFDKKYILLSLSAGSDFFSEISKLRAYRLLVNNLLNEYKIKCPVYIHVQTGTLNKSHKDPYTNLLRSTTEGMSAVIGDCDSLSVTPYNSPFEDATDFSTRMSINQQHILRYETYLDKTNDISEGSYFVEHLTNELAEKAWEKFKEIESKGGLISCLKSGEVQKWIDHDFNTLLDEYKSGKRVLIGVNKFPNPNDQPLKKSEFKDSENGKMIKRVLPRLIENHLD